MSIRILAIETLDEYQILRVEITEDGEVATGWESWCLHEDCTTGNLAVMVSHDDATTAVAVHVHERPPADIPQGSLRRAVAAEMRASCSR